ncbi:HflK protein [compost metagenome]
MLTEYQKAPQVTRERMYTDAMQEIYSNVTKVLVDSKAGNNLLYLPLDKIMQMTAQSPATAPATALPPPTAGAASTSASRSLDNAARSRERESR